MIIKEQENPEEIIEDLSNKNLQAVQKIMTLEKTNKILFSILDSMKNRADNLVPMIDPERDDSENFMNLLEIVLYRIRTLRKDFNEKIDMVKELRT